MTNLRTISLRVLSCALLFSAVLAGPAAVKAQSAAPAVRIVTPIDEGQLVTLKGNTLASANAKNDRGIVSPSLRMTDLILVLSRSPQQQAAFDAYVAGEYDQNSPNYHQWLTPQQIGAQFGPAPADVATISGWLASHGFTVDAVTPDNMTIRFSGNAGQVQSAFHTEIHNLMVNGKPHIANMSDPQIPAALAPVIVGIKALHNFFPRPEHHLGGTVTRDSATGKWERIASRATGSSTLTQLGPAAKALATAKPTTAKPQFGISGTSEGEAYLVEDVDPWDFATIYNILPLWNAGTPIDGTGQTIAIAGTSDIDVGQSSSTETGANGNNDVLTFRNYFGLPTGNAVNTPIRISGNSQPLTVCTDTTGTVPYVDNPCGIDDLTENSLDVEWSGSVAKNAQIVLVSSYPASVTDDNLYDSESYIVNHLTARIMNVSYGECELSNGTAGNVEYYDLWQQAAAEGISVFVAAGDSGSASCDDGNLFAESGLSVSGLASTPYDTAVGGTDFNWCNPDTAFGTGTTPCAAAPYWSSTAITSQGSTQPVTTALGYVPETPWNESCANPLTLKWSQDLANFMGSIYGGFSGSNITTPEQACNFIADFYFYDTPGYYGYEYGLLYYDPYYANLLQVVGGSGGASNCVVGTATTNTETGEITGCTTGATSTGNTTNPDTGASQASLTLVNNGWPKPSWQTGVTGIPSDGVRDIPDVSFFAADGFISSSAYLICVSQADPSHACTYSTYSEPVYQEVGGTSVATPAMAGVMALINQKTGVSQGLAAPELYSLAHNQTYSSCSAETVTASGNGGECLFNDIDAGPTSATPYTNAQPCDAGIYGNGVTTPNCLANQSTLGYADAGEGLGISTGYSAGTGYDLATGLGSLNVANVVNHWVSVIGSGATTVTVSPSPNPVSLGASVSVTVTVGSNPSGSTTPTGSVTLSGGGYTSSAETLVSGGTDSTGSYTFTIPAGALAGGTDTLTADYSGDANYASSTGSNTVTVNKNNATVSATPSPTSIESNQQVVITGTVTCSGTCTGAATPTGTVTVSYGTSYTSQAAMLVSGQYSVTITPNSIPGGTPNQNDTLTVNYSGDDNYNAASTTTSVAVTFFQVQTPTLTITPTSTTVDSGSPLLVTVSVSCVMPPATACPTTPGGTVTLTGGGFATVTPASMTLTDGTAQFTIPANTLNSNPLAPTTDTLTANFLGDADYAQVQTTLNLTVTQSAYTVSATSPGSSVTPGSTATSSVSVATTTNYTGTVTFSNASCVLTGYPSGVTSATLGNPTCALTGNGTVTITDGSPSGPVTFTVSTTSTTTPLAALTLPKFSGDSPENAGILALAARPSAPARHSNGAGWFETAGGAALAALFLFFVPGGTRKWRQMLGVVLLMFAISFTIAGCGGGSSTPSGPATLATPTVTVTPSVTSVAINGSAFTVSVNVTGTAGTATGGVTLTGAGYTSGAGTGTLASGTTSFTVNPSSFTSDGTVTLTAEYSGNAAYNPASGTATVAVSNVPTTPGTYTFTVKPTSSTPALSTAASTTFTVDVN